MDRPTLAAGVTQVAAGAVSGWPLAGLYASPELRAKLGITDVQRLRQAHLDVIIMGGLVALSSLVDDVPAWARTATRVGAWTNALLFVPLAIRPDAVKSKPYVAASVASFAVTTAGWVTTARTARRNARR